MKTKRITAKTKFDEIMKINPDAGMILFEYGLHCVGCGLASMETLEQGCMAHGMSKENVKELVGKLNENGGKEDKVAEKKKGLKKVEKKKIVKKAEKKIKKLPKKNKKNSIKKLKKLLE